MLRRVIGAAVVATAIGLGGGAAAAYLVRPATSPDGVPSPVPAEGPSVPYLPTKTPPVVAADIDYPAMTTPTRLKRLTVGNSLATWSIVKPKGWQATCTDTGTPVSDAEAQGCVDGGVSFRPPGEPTVGGYSFRVQTLADHVTLAAETATKVSRLVDGDAYADVQVLSQDDRSVYFTLLVKQIGLDSYLSRHNFFQWFAIPGSTQATLEMSVTGRAVDDPALRSFFTTFANEARAITPS